MITSRRKTALAINGVSKSLTVADNPSGWSAEKTLWIITPLRVPGWSIFFRSSHTKALTLQHLVLKFILKGTNKNETRVLEHLCVDLPEQDYEILELILSNQHKIQKSSGKVLSEISKHSFLGITDPIRQFESFEPELTAYRVWTDRAKIAPKRYIGVGYKDHGSLSSGPSWKEQQTDDGEDTPRLGVLLYSLKVTLGYVLSRTPPLWELRPAEELQKRAKQEGRR